MAVNKNFVVKNGFEVNTNLILADADSQRVGIGSTQPEHTLDVRGGIGATDIIITGLSTFVTDVQVGASGSIFYVSNSSNNVGVGTSVPAYTLDVRGPVSTGTTALFVYGDAYITGDLNIDDFTLDELYVAGISTLVGFSTFEDYVFIQDGLNVGGGVTAASLDISGVSTFTGNVDINSFTDISGNVNIGGITTVGGAVDINSFTDISGNVNIGGITTVANYVLIQSGLDVAGVGATTTTLNVTGVSTFGSNVDVNSFVDVSGDLNVGGLSTFVGVGTFQDDLFVGGDLTIDGSIVYGDATAANIDITGIATVGSLLDVNGDVDISNNLNVVGLTTLGGFVDINDSVNISNNLDIGGNLTIGGTFFTVNSQDVYIANKDIILGYTTSVTPDDDTANHAGLAIASTEGSSLVSFEASGINTLPDTYKQLMWFKSGTLGFSTDAFGFNYGVAIGTTTMADGVRFAVGSGLTVTETSVDISGSLDVTGITTLASSGGITTTGGDLYVSGVATATSFYGDGSNLTGVTTALTAAVGVSSEGTFVGTGATIINFASTNGTAMDVTVSGGIATAIVTPGVSIGLAIALGG